MNYDILKSIADEYGESFYMLNSDKFKKNFLELQEAFRKIYSKTFIAYSYKTNYIPKLCKIVDELGGYAEVVSDMEYELAKRIGVKSDKIIFNGPYKNMTAVEELLLDGGCINVDSLEELSEIIRIAEEHLTSRINIGVRVNFEVENCGLSRFGIDIESKEFITVLNEISNHDNIVLKEFHCHYAPRSLETWKVRAEKMIQYVNEFFDEPPMNIDLGGGLYGKMPAEMKQQFNSYIPEYKEYAEIVATLFAKHFKSEEKPMLFIEPGTALVGDALQFVAKTVGIKNIRGKSIATLLGSVYNINPTLNGKNPPITLYHKDGLPTKSYVNLDFGGYTCIESDYLYKGYTGNLSIDDYVVFDNVGSYSIVLKPPFILPNFAIVDYDGEKTELIKKQESFDDLFHTFSF